MAVSGFQAGHGRIGGRKKGTPNKKTRLLQDFFDELSFDVPGELIKILPDLAPTERAKILLELMQYLYPKRKAVELASDSGEKTLEEILSESWRPTTSGQE